MRCQLEASLPLRKRLWQALVKAKIAQQGIVLELMGVSGAEVTDLTRRVKSGDPDNAEAQAARRYCPGFWERLPARPLRPDAQSPTQLRPTRCCGRE